MTVNYRNSAGTDLDNLFYVANNNAGAIGFRASGGQDLGNRYPSGSLGYGVGYKNSAGTDIGYLRTNVYRTITIGSTSTVYGYSRGSHGSVTGFGDLQDKITAINVSYLLKAYSFVVGTSADLNGRVITVTIGALVKQVTVSKKTVGSSVTYTGSCNISESEYSYVKNNNGNTLALEIVVY